MRIMKIAAGAGALYRASALADAATDDSRARKFPALGTAHLQAGDGLTFTVNTLDHMITMQVAGATVETAGALVLSCTQLKQIVSTLPAEAEVVIEDDGTAARLSNARRRYKLLITPLSDLPPPLRLDDELGHVQLDRAAAAALFARPDFAVDVRDVRDYLCGISLHDTDGGLAAVATNGHVLARMFVSGVTGLSHDAGLIVPAPAIKVINRLLADKAIDTIIMRRSATLFALETPNVVFVCRRIDGTFPDYQRIIPVTAGNSMVNVDRSELRAALVRAAAVAKKRYVQIAWRDGELRLHAGDLVDDVLDAETNGSGQITLQNHLLAGLLDALVGTRIRLSADKHEPVLITDSDTNFLAVLAQSVPL
jgi:DNA polymerase-3 subunit beta